MKAELVGAALEMAGPPLASRGVESSITPTRDSQYTSLAFGEHCREAGIAQSNGLGGRRIRQRLCVRAFSPRSECELIDRRRFPTVAKARREDTCQFIEGFYNDQAGSTPRSATSRRRTS